MKTFLTANWENIVMINYLVDRAVLLPYLPHGVDLDTYEDKVFVSLVGFKFAKSKIFGVSIPIYGSFDEVNLRFYVKREDGGELKRGVVFISEIVPYQIVSFLANSLYKEHYRTAKMESSITLAGKKKYLKYAWKTAQNNCLIDVIFENEVAEIEANSEEEFIYEHYYGFTKVNENETWEYKVNHSRWKTNKVESFDIKCDFEKMYGSPFSFLNQQAPYSVYNAIGSEVSIDWKINKIIK